MEKAHMLDKNMADRGKWTNNREDAKMLNLSVYRVYVNRNSNTDIEKLYTIIYIVTSYRHV